MLRSYNYAGVARDLSRLNNGCAVTAPALSAQPIASKPELSVIIPCWNAPEDLAHCLAALRTANFEDLEVIIVDDGSTADLTSAIAQSGIHAKYFRMESRSGPAVARNLGARHATGAVLLFLDSDVCIHRDTLERVTECFAHDPNLQAVMGAYDEHPHAPDFHSQFRNLLHCYVHRNSRRSATTFWTGCGAIRAAAFHECGGFDENLRGMDDVELGMRLTRSGGLIELRPEIQVQHRKRWSFLQWMKTDLFMRGIPWTQVALRYRSFPGELNLTYRNRASVAMAVCAALLAVMAAVHPERALLASIIPLVGFLLGSIVWVNRGLYSLFFKRHGIAFATGGAAAHIVHLWICGLAFVCGAVMFAFGPASAHPRGSREFLPIGKAAGKCGL